MADFFEIEYLKKDHESGKIYTRYMYLSIDHLMYWEYIKMIISMAKCSATDCQIIMIFMFPKSFMSNSRMP